MNHHDIRQTAVDAERHWWSQRLYTLSSELRGEALRAKDAGEAAKAIAHAEAVEAIIARRVRP